MIDITQYLPARRRRSSGGWISFNAVCCHHRGERADTRGRGGILVTADGFSYNCFNCAFTAGYKQGERLNFKTRQLLSWLGVDAGTIDALVLTALRDREFANLLAPPTPRPRLIQFPEFELEPSLVCLDPDNPDHEKYTNYLRSRALDPLDYSYLVSPEATGRDSNRIVVPFTWHSKIVGQSARYLDDRRPKYIHSIPPGYVFGVDLQPAHWRRLIVVEGVFDALAINGVAVLHNDINDNQAAAIAALNREVIVVPDQDRAGIQLAERALELGWSVSVPDWNVKDVADAVKVYGRLGTLITICESASANHIKFELKRRKFA